MLDVGESPELNLGLFLKMGPKYMLIADVLLMTMIISTRNKWGLVELFQVLEIEARLVGCYLDQNKVILVFAEM